MDKGDCSMLADAAMDERNYLKVNQAMYPTFESSLLPKKCRRRDREIWHQRLVLSNLLRSLSDLSNHGGEWPEEKRLLLLLVCQFLLSFDV